MTREQFELTMRAYFNDVHSNSAIINDINHDTNLFTTGLVESLGLPPLISYLEREIGKPIDLRKASIESFFTLDRIFADVVQPALSTAEVAR